MDVIEQARSPTATRTVTLGTTIRGSRACRSGVGSCLRIDRRDRCASCAAQMVDSHRLARPLLAAGARPHGSFRAARVARIAASVVRASATRRSGSRAARSICADSVQKRRDQRQRSCAQGPQFPRTPATLVARRRTGAPEPAIERLAVHRVGIRRVPHHGRANFACALLALGPRGSRRSATKTARDSSALFGRRSASKRQFSLASASAPTKKLADGDRAFCKARSANGA